MPGYYLLNINPEEINASTATAEDSKLQNRIIDTKTLEGMFPVEVNIDQIKPEPVKKMAVLAKPKQEDAPVSAEKAAAAESKKKDRESPFEKVVLQTQYFEGDKAAEKQEGLPAPETAGETKADTDCAEESKKHNNNLNDPLQKGKLLHKMALSGDKKAAWESFVFFAKALESNPADPVVKAFHVDCLSMVERYSNVYSQEPLTAPCRSQQYEN